MNGSTACNLIAAVDYKSSVYSTPGGGNKQAWDDGIVLQVPLYAWALTQLNPGKEVCRVEYRALKQRKLGHTLQLYQVTKTNRWRRRTIHAKMDAALDAAAGHVGAVRERLLCCESAALIQLPAVVPRLGDLPGAGWTEGNGMVDPIQLDDAQWEAVRRVNEHVLVAAGAGTGKTNTVVGRILYLLGVEFRGERIDTPVTLHDIAAITFTNAAAADLRKKIRLALQAAGRRDDASAGGYRQDWHHPQFLWRSAAGVRAPERTDARCCGARGG